MRNSLLWRILAVAILPLIIFYFISTNFYGDITIREFISNNSFLLFILILSISLLSLVVSNNYLKHIENLINNINQPAFLAELFYKTKGLPVEMQRLYKSVLNTLSKSNKEKEEFQSEKAVFSSILSNMNDGILVVDENSNVTLINQSACSIFNVSRQEAIGHSLVKVIRHHKMNELLDKTAAARTPQIESFETAPEKTFIRCIATPLDKEMPGSILFLMQDLTRIRQLEIIRRDFVSNVSHELRTPLTSLKLITETLQENLLDDPSESQRFLDRMSGEIDNLTQMVEELLELSKIESGRVPLEKRWVKPNKIVTSAHERMALQAQRAGLQCSIKLAENLPNIFVDPSRLERVLVNLLHNAIKFTSPGGMISLTAYQKMNTIVFSVKDSGVGIKSKDLARVFERFYKSDRSRTDRGTGLGLSIARHLVEAHGGKIWAESQIGEGSTFSFSIPLTKQ